MTEPNTTPISRYHAFAYHLLISLAVFVVLAWLVVFVWYPDFFYAIDGGWEGMRIIIAVDLVLGPVLTLIVYKAGKPGLKFDLVMIGLFQSTCLAAGVYIVYVERPLFFVYYEKHFYSSSADTFERYAVPAPDPKRYSDTTPAYVISTLPENPIEEADVRRILFQDGLPAWAYQATYSPLADHLPEILAEGTAESELVQRDTVGNLDRWLADNGGTFDDYAFFPIHSRYRDAFLGIRRSDLRFVGIVLIPPPM
jgi:hypothetical protein